MPGTKSLSSVGDSHVGGASVASDDADLLEEAEARAAEAEALAAAARGRLEAIRLQQNARTTADASDDASEVSGLAGSSAPSRGEKTEKLSAAGGAIGVPTGDTPASPAAPEEPTRLGRRFRRPTATTLLASIAVLCTAALLAVSVVLVRHHDDITRTQQRAAEFTAAARQVVVTLMSIDAANAKDDVQRIIDSSTGQFKDEFQRAANDFIKVAESAKVSVKTSVQAAAVESMTAETAVVLVAASSTLTNTAGGTEQPRSWRLSVKLAKDGGQIKMSSMEFIP